MVYFEGSCTRVFLGEKTPKNLRLRHQNTRIVVLKGRETKSGCSKDCELA